MIGALELVNQRVIARVYVRGAVILVVSLHYTRLLIAAGNGILLFSEVPSV